VKKSSRPLGDLGLDAIAETVCREFGYLCIDKNSLGDMYPLVASELAVLETYNFLSKGKGDKEPYEPVAACLDDEECLGALIDTVNRVLDIYLRGDGYFLSLSREDLEKAIRIAEIVASRFEEQTSLGEKQVARARTRGSTRQGE